MDHNFNKIDKYINDLSSNVDDISTSIKKYKKIKDIINRSQEQLNNTDFKIQNIEQNISLPDNFNFNENMEKIKNSLESINKDNENFEEFISNYINIKQLIFQCNLYINNSKLSIKQLIQDDEKNFVEISHTFK